MIGTVKMKKGEVIVSVRNTPDDIVCAKSQGYVLVETKPNPNPNPSMEQNPGTGGTGTGTGNTGGDSGKENTGLASLDKKELFDFIGKRNLCDNSYKKLEPAEIIPKVFEAVREKIVEAKLKTAEEAAAIAEKELFELFDTIK